MNFSKKKFNWICLLFLLFSVILAAGCTDNNKAAMEEYLEGRELIDLAQEKTDDKERLKLFQQAIEIFERVAKNYPQTVACERILEVSDSPYSLHAVKIKVSNIQLASDSQNIAGSLTEAKQPELVTQKAEAKDNLLASLEEWMVKNNLRLDDANGYDTFAPARDSLVELYSKINIPEDEYRKYTSKESDLNARLAFFSKHKYDFSILPTPSTWVNQGLIIQTVSADNKPQLWFKDSKTLEIVELEIDNEGRAGLMSYHEMKGYPEIIQVQHYFEACDPYFYIGEVRSKITQIRFEYAQSENDKDFAYFDEDYKVLEEDETWITYQRVYPRKSFPSATGLPKVYHTPTIIFKKIGFIWGDNVNVREKGGDDYKNQKVLFQLNKGESVVVLGKENNWFNIAKFNDDKSTGWVIEDFIKHVPPLEISNKEKMSLLEDLKKETRGLIESTNQFFIQMYELGAKTKEQKIINSIANATLLQREWLHKITNHIPDLELYDCSLDYINLQFKQINSMKEMLSKAQSEFKKVEESLEKKLEAKSEYENMVLQEQSIYRNIDSLYFETIEVLNAKLWRREKDQLINKAESIISNLPFIQDFDKRMEAERFLDRYKEVMSDSSLDYLDRLSYITTSHNRLKYYLK